MLGGGGGESTKAGSPELRHTSHRKTDTMGTSQRTAMQPRATAPEAGRLLRGRTDGGAKRLQLGRHEHEGGEPHKRRSTPFTMVPRACPTCRPTSRTS